MSSIGTIPLGLSGQIPLRPEPASKLSGGDDRKQAETARGFEATLLGQLIKEMRTSDDPEGGLFPGDTGDVYGGLFDLYLGQYLADAGGSASPRPSADNNADHLCTRNRTRTSARWRSSCWNNWRLRRVAPARREGVMGLYSALRKGDLPAVQAAVPANDVLAGRLAAAAEQRQARLPGWRRPSGWRARVSPWRPSPTAPPSRTGPASAPPARSCGI
jgi:hypothetical protein